MNTRNRYMTEIHKNYNFRFIKLTVLTWMIGKYFKRKEDIFVFGLLIR